MHSALTIAFETLKVYELEEIDCQMNCDQCSQNVLTYITQEKEVVHQTSVRIDKIKTVLCTVILIDLYHLTCY